MPIDPQTETLITFKQAPLIGLKKGNPSPQKLERMARKGRKNQATQKQIFLETHDDGGRIWTSVEAYWRFIAALNAR